jgi:hypothetical protein
MLEKSLAKKDLTNELRNRVSDDKADFAFIFMIKKLFLSA